MWLLRRHWRRRRRLQHQQQQQQQYVCLGSSRQLSSKSKPFCNSFVRTNINAYPLPPHSSLRFAAPPRCFRSADHGGWSRRGRSVKPFPPAWLLSPTTSVPPVQSAYAPFNFATIANAHSPLRSGACWAAGVCVRSGAGIVVFQVRGTRSALRNKTET